MASGYRPELDSSPYLDPSRASYFMSLKGILRWAIELGRIDIMVEAGLLSRFQAAPREGHLEQMFHIMAYLKNNNKSRLVFDHSNPTFTNINDSNVDWQEQPARAGARTCALRGCRSQVVAQAAGARGPQHRLRRGHAARTDRGRAGQQ